MEQDQRGIQRGGREQGERSLEKGNPRKILKWRGRPRSS